MANVASDFIIRKILEKAVTDPNSKLTETQINLNELCKQIFKDLQCNTFCEMEKDDGGSGYCEFMAWINSKHDDKRIDRLAKSALGHAWIYKWGIDCSENDIASSDEEWEEYGNESLPNTIDDSHLEPNVDTRNKNTKQCENGFNTQNAPSSSNMEDAQPDKKWFKVEKFEVIKYSIRDSEEFLAIRTRECNSWAQTVNGVSNIYHDIFSKKDNKWTVH
nr:hypothetical protein [Tanacetum cinerariifolium]